MVNSKNILPIGTLINTPASKYFYKIVGYNKECTRYLVQRLSPTGNYSSYCVRYIRYCKGVTIIPPSKASELLYGT